MERSMWSHNCSVEQNSKEAYSPSSDVNSNYVLFCMLRVF